MYAELVNLLLLCLVYFRMLIQWIHVVVICCEVLICMYMYMYNTVQSLSWPKEGVTQVLSHLSLYDPVYTVHDSIDLDIIVSSNRV